MIFINIELAEAGGDPRASEPTCIIHALCDLYDGVSVEAKTIKEFWLKPKLRQMLDGGVSTVVLINYLVN
jgi:hypothetical protein